MKKLFTLIAVALVALSANAKLDLSLDELPNGWGSTYDAATKTISYEAGAWGGRGWNLSAVANLTDYDYLVVELAKASELKLKLNIEYADEVNATENNGNNTDATLENPGTLVAVQLDKDESYALQAYVANNQWQSVEPNNPAGTATLQAAYLCTEAEYKAALEENAKKELKKEFTIADAVDGVLTMKAGESGWHNAGWLAMDVTKYKTLVVDLGAVTGTTGLTIQGNKDDQIIINPSEKPQVIYWTIPEGFTTLNQFAFQNFNKETEEEADTKETVVNINSIYLTSKAKEDIVTGINHSFVAPKANVNAPIYNLAGQQVSKAYKGVVIQNGKKFVQK